MHFMNLHALYLGIKEMALHSCHAQPILYNQKDSKHLPQKEMLKLRTDRQLPEQAEPV